MPEIVYLTIEPDEEDCFNQFLQTLKSLNPMNIIKRIREKFRKRAVLEMEREIENSVQIREFNGSLYVCHYDAPIVKVENLKISPVEAVQAARNDYTKWKLRNK